MFLFLNCFIIINVYDFEMKMFGVRYVIVNVGIVDVGIYEC